MMIVVALVCILFLLHFRSAFVAIFTLPVGILASFLIMYPLGITANIMSLGGIAIAIGVMVDASVGKLCEDARRSGVRPFPALPQGVSHLWPSAECRGDSRRQRRRVRCSDSAAFIGGVRCRGFAAHTAGTGANLTLLPVCLWPMNEQPLH